jgi:predicted ester cyclase
MSREANIEATRRLIDEGFTLGRLEVCDEVVDARMVEHQRGLRPGIEGAKDTIRTLHAWFSEFELRIEDLVATDDTVWIRNRATGLNAGRVFGNPPTDRRFEIVVFDVLRFRDGKLVEHWGVPDQLGLLAQLGLFSPRASAPEVGERLVDARSA